MSGKSEPVTHKVILVGDSAVGKTAIINRYIYGSVSAEHQPTVGIDFFAKSIKDGNKTVRMQIWDTAGQEKFHSLIPSYIRNSTVAIFVYDITSRQSFDDLEKWHKIVTDVAEPKLVIAANKIDLDGERQVTEEEGKKWAEAHSAKFIETSARTPTNIDELFQLVGQTSANEPVVEEAAPAEQANVIVDVKETEAPAKKGGCC